MSEKQFLKDILLQKKPFQFTKKDTGEVVTMYECYSMTEQPYNENGYIVKHFYATEDKIKDIEILAKVNVRYSKQYKKFYVL